MPNTRFIEPKSRNRLRALIAERGIQQQELAITIGISESKLSRYLRGRIDLKDEEKSALCRALRITRAKLRSLGG